MTVEISWISYDIWDISQHKYLIHNRGRDFLDILKSQLLTAEYFFYECVLNLKCSKVCFSSRCNHFDIVVKTPHVVCCKT